LESLKEEEKALLEDIKTTEKELLKLEQNLNLAQELRREVIQQFFFLRGSAIPFPVGFCYR
jgi:DNA gyrase/topoisomerase IV subunit A